jgi:selenide,water dikinase
MVQLNKAGATFGKLPYVKAMTDVTGFGLLGHLSEMSEGSELSARVEFDKLPKLPTVDYYIGEGCIPGGTKRNWASYGHKIAPFDEEKRTLLCDPQTSGGLLVAVDPAFEQEFLQVASEGDLSVHAVGEMTEAQEFRVYVS